MMRALTSAFAAAALNVLVAQSIDPPQAVDRTTTFQARMTPAQREHGREHAKNDIIGARELAQHGLTPHRILDEGTSIDLAIDLIGVEATMTVRQMLTATACGNAIVFEGRVLTKESFPTEDGTFLFTDYEVEAIEIFRGLAGLSARSRVTVTRLGGSVAFDGGSVNATISTAPTIETNRTYLFFGRSLAATGAVSVNESNDVLPLEKSRFTAAHFPPATDLRDLSRRGFAADSTRRTLRQLTCR